MDLDDEDAYLYGEDGTPEVKPVVLQAEEQAKTAEQNALDAAIAATLQQYGESTEAIQAALASHEDEYDGIKNGEDEPDDEEVEQEDESDDDDDLDIVTVAPQRSVDFRNPSAARPSGPGAMFLSGMGLTHQMLPPKATRVSTASATPSATVAAQPSVSAEPQSTLSHHTEEDQSAMTVTSIAGPTVDMNGTAVPTGSQPQPSSDLPIARAPDNYPKVDYLAPPLLQDGQSVYEYDLAVMDGSGQPWRRPGSDLSRWFNYGFDEVTWVKYCEYRRDMSKGREGLMNLQPGMPLTSEIAQLMHMPEPTQLAPPPDAMQQMQQMMMQQMMQNQPGMQFGGMNGFNPEMMGMMGGMGGMGMQMPMPMQGMMGGGGGGGTPGARAHMNSNTPGEIADNQPHGEDVQMEDGMIHQQQPDFQQHFPPLPTQGNFPGQPFPPGQPGHFGGGFRGNMRGRGMGPMGPARGGGMPFRGRGGMVAPTGPRNPNANPIPTGPKAGRIRDRDRAAADSTELDYGGGETTTPTPSAGGGGVAGRSDSAGVIDPRAMSPARRVRRGSPDVKRETEGSVDYNERSPSPPVSEVREGEDGRSDVGGASPAKSTTEMRIKGKSKEDEGGAQEEREESSNGGTRSRDERERGERDRDRVRRDRERPSRSERDKDNDPATRRTSSRDKERDRSTREKGSDRTREKRSSRHESGRVEREKTTRSSKDGISETGSASGHRRDEGRSRKRSASPAADGEGTRSSKARKR